MAQKDLIPLNKRTKEEQKEIQSKGGIKSGETRRKRKALRESMSALLDLPITDARGRNKLLKMGLPAENLDNSQLIVLGLFNRAKAGDVYAIRELRNLIGEDEIRKDEGQLEDLIKGMQDEV